MRSGEARLTTGARWVLLVVAVVMILPLAAGPGVNDKARSAWEKRPLHRRPAWQGWHRAADFFSKTDLYLNDHVAFALPLNRVYRKALFYVFGDNPVPTVGVDLDGFVFLNSHGRIPYELYEKLCAGGVEAPPDKVASRVATLEKIFAALSDRGYRVSLAVPVSKPVLYPEKLSSRVPAHYREACRCFRETENFVVQVRDRLVWRGWIVTYPMDEFVKLKDDPYFYPKTNYHFRGMSAHVFSRHMLDELGIETSRLDASLRTVADIPWDLSMTGFRHSSRYWKYEYPSFEIDYSWRKPPFVDGYLSRVPDYARAETARPLSERRALVFSDSFGRYAVVHLATGFRTLHHVNLNHIRDHEYDRFFSEFVDRMAPTDIIFIVRDGGLVDGYIFDKIADSLQRLRLASEGT